MNWLLLLLAISPGDVYRDFPDARALTPAQLTGAIRAETPSGELSLALLSRGKATGPVRVFYGTSVAGPAGRILAPRNGGVIHDDPVIRFSAEGEGELWAYFEQYGAAWRRITPEWKTYWVPDQPAGGLKFQLRVRRADGLWAVARQVDGVTLLRRNLSVKLYQAGHPGAAALAGATEAAWLVGDDIRPVPLDQLGAPPQPGAALLVRYARPRAR
ncbi:MAG: hypothetical protein ACK58M_25385 [Acidobacteriota bacterium]|jgi:hypothetical protein|nr:hypothetical protein [Bryobacteraceae bacterium CoA2 C42]MCA2966164.1 hypothetical protein [Acidobacteriaceae bacterium]